MDTETLILVLSAAGGALATAIGVLFRTVMSLSNRQSQMSEELGLLKGEHKGIRELSYQVLDTVHKAAARRHRSEEPIKQKDKDDR